MKRATAFTIHVQDKGGRIIISEGFRSKVRAFAYAAKMLDNYPSILIHSFYAPPPYAVQGQLPREFGWGGYERRNIPTR